MGSGQLILNDLPASPNDAFYDVHFEATQIGAASESFSIQVKESGAFAHGPQSYFSGLDLTFQYSKKKGLSISSGGTITLHLNKGVFSPEETVLLVPEWQAASETLVFTASASAQIQMDSIGKLGKLKVALGSTYDRWARVQGLYTFDGGLDPAAKGEFAAHDISGQGAPSLYFEGKQDFRKNPNEAYGAEWTNRGIAFGGSGILASRDNIPNPVVDSIQESEAFSVEIWMKPAEALQEGPARIFSIEGPGYDNYFIIGQGPWNEGPYQQNYRGPGADLNVSYKYRSSGLPDLRNDWEKPFKSPANALTTALMHVVYSCDQEGMQRIFINGAQVAQRSDPGYYNAWLGALRLVLGNDLNKNKPWKGEIHQLAIFSRALTATEVRQHYQPDLAISGDFSLDAVIPPLQGEFFPFSLNSGSEDAALTAARELDLEINPRLGFRQVDLECVKSPDSAWSFSGTFLTRFWEDLVPLKASLEAGRTGPARLNLSGPGPSGTSKPDIVLLRIGEQNAWELSFGTHREYAVVPLVLENSMPDYGEFRLGNPQIVLGEPITMKGKWLGENMAFTSVGKGTNRVMKGSTAFALPFTLELPPEVDPETGDAWGDAILLKDVDMNISLDVTLLKDGFLGVLNASFAYENRVMALPERRIYEAPASKMALLGAILEDLKAQASDLFTGLRRHTEDYYLDMNAGAQPCIYLSTTGTAESTIESILPRIFTSNPSPAYVSNPPVFKLSQSAAGAKLTLNLNGVDAAGIRTAFDDLISQIEDKKGLSPGGLRLLQNRIAERLPLEYNDLLYYHYGWDIPNNYIDLHPGMRLRVDFQSYQFVHATEQKAKKGFVGSGSIHIPINSYTGDDGAQYVGFGPFLSRLQADNRGYLSEDGAGGLIDLVKVGSRKQFFRMFYPNQPIPATAPERSVTIVGANLRKDLPYDIPVTGSGDLISFFFRDKAMVIPEIQVFVGNREVYVPVGTTLRQLIEQYANIPVALGAQPNLHAFLGKARPRRLIHTGPDNTPLYRFLNPGTNSVVNNRDVFDLPLVKGDRFYF